MFCLRLCLRLRLLPGTRVSDVSRHSAHKLASLHGATKLPPNKTQNLLYPFSGLEAYLDRSVDRTPFQLFHPSVEDMVNAEKLFNASPTHKIDYYVSAERMDHVPALRQPEVCFIGRSNVGKSSLIKALFSLTPEVEVRVSKTPMLVTKIDKCGHGTLLTNLLSLQEVVKTRTSCCFPQPLLVSSLQFLGIYLLRCFICHLTGSIRLTDTSQIRAEASD
ncbi:putative GTP-binding protein 8 isoform 6 [Scophthalmus maximus]|uniref:Putative GTP-binding protein 8 isoform 6 n=1 Tax=Scophthalmus maximus TaxID=52904 RepID=A0A2U9CAE8_SCOMX|nr:putative GTP-binding protein 8 isoform 6 [Scophthalmus maximus]